MVFAGIEVFRKDGCENYFIFGNLQILSLVTIKFALGFYSVADITMLAANDETSPK